MEGEITLEIAMAKSEERTNFLGDKFTVHFDDDGNKIGESRERTNWVGDPYIEHTDAAGGKIGESHDRTNWVGDPYIEHTDAAGSKIGVSHDRTGWIGDHYVEHTDATGSKIGESHDSTGWIGDRYVEHVGYTPYTHRPEPIVIHKAIPTRSETDGSYSVDEYDARGETSPRGCGKLISDAFWALVVIGVFVLFQATPNSKPNPSSASPLPPTPTAQVNAKQLTPVPGTTSPNANMLRPTFEVQPESPAIEAPPIQADTFPSSVYFREPRPVRGWYPNWLYQVVGVRSDDQDGLNVRFGPGEGAYDIAAHLPWNADEVMYLGRYAYNGPDLWLLIRWGDVVGWVQSGYLSEQP